MADTEHHPHPNKHRIERAERFAEMMPIVFVIGLALALLVGFLTTPHATW